MIDKINQLVNMSGPRDPIFLQILDNYKDRPTRIFQVGAIETLDNELFKIGSGWSDVLFGSHIKRYGGLLCLNDILVDHLAHSKIVADHIGYEYQLNYGDALGHIDDSYDIYYLDGSNDPRETTDQFHKIMSFNKNNIHILIDDFSIKGTGINVGKYRFNIHNIEKGLGVLHCE